MMKYKSVLGWLLAAIVGVGAFCFTPWDFLLYGKNARLTSELNADSITSNLQGIERFEVIFDRAKVQATVVYSSRLRTNMDMNGAAAARSCLKSYVVRRWAGQWIVLTDGYESGKAYQPECFAALKYTISEIRSNLSDAEKINESWAAPDLG